MREFYITNYNGDPIGKMDLDETVIEQIESGNRFDLSFSINTSSKSLISVALICQMLVKGE